MTTFGVVDITVFYPERSIRSRTIKNIVFQAGQPITPHLYVGPHFDEDTSRRDYGVGGQYDTTHYIKTPLQRRYGHYEKKRYVDHDKMCGINLPYYKDVVRSFVDETSDHYALLDVYIPKGWRPFVLPYKYIPISGSMYLIGVGQIADAVRIGVVKHIPGIAPTEALQDIALVSESHETEMYYKFLAKLTRRYGYWEVDPQYASQILGHNPSEDGW